LEFSTMYVQRQRCNRLARFWGQIKYFCFQNAFFGRKELFFFSKRVTRGVVKFYSVGVVTRDRNIGSRLDFGKHINAE
jgi:hypothetical protein